MSTATVLMHCAIWSQYASFSICSLGEAYARKIVIVYSVSDKHKPEAEAEAIVADEGQLRFETDHCSLWYVAAKDGAAGETNAHTGTH